MHTIPIGESFARIVLGHIKRFHFQSMVYTTGCLFLVLESLLLALSLDIYIFKAWCTPQLQDAYSWYQFLSLQKFFD